MLEIFAESRAAVKWAMVGAVVLGATIPTASWLLNSAESAQAPAWNYTVVCMTPIGKRMHQVSEAGIWFAKMGPGMWSASDNGVRGIDIAGRPFVYSISIPCWLENAQ